MRIPTLVLSFCLAILFPIPNLAEEFNVGDSKALQDALIIAKANAQDDTIFLNPGIYTTRDNQNMEFHYQPVEMEDNFSLSLIGTGAPGSVILDGTDLTRVLHIATNNLNDDSKVTITLNNLIIQKGNPHADANLDNRGGGLRLLTRSANIKIVNCSFQQNTLTGASSLCLEGGGVFLHAMGFGNVDLHANTFSNNYVTSECPARGGGISLRTNGTTVIKLGQNTFTGNAVSSGSDSEEIGIYGGGAAIDTGARGSALINRNKFFNNQVKHLATTGETLGGGAFLKVTSGKLQVTNNSFVNNLVQTNASGISLELAAGGGLATIISGKKSTGVVQLINNTFTLNTSNKFAGGFIASADSDKAKILIVNNIVYDNTAATLPKTVENATRNYFLADNQDNNGLGTPVWFYHNLIAPVTEISQCKLTSTNCQSQVHMQNNINAAPLLQDAANNNIHLKHGSPAINAGQKRPGFPIPVMDIDGDVRDALPDIGADEFL